VALSQEEATEAVDLEVLDRNTGHRLDWACGRRDKATLKKMVDRLAP